MNTSNGSSVYSSHGVVHITASSVNLVLGIPINSWVLWLVLTGPAGTMASEIFTFNLSLCEIIFSLLYVGAANKNIPLLQAFAGALMFTGRPVFQCCICVERFMAVVHPVLFIKYKPLRYRVACSAVAWMLIVGIILLLVLVEITGHSLNTVSYVYFGEFLFFMSVMLLCSLAVLRALKQPMPGETGRERERDTSMKRRAFTIICLIMVSFVGTFFIWSIFFILAAQEVFSPDVAEVLMAGCMCITVLSGLVQPLLYICRKTGKLPCVKPIEDT